MMHDYQGDNITVHKNTRQHGCTHKPQGKLEQ